MNFIVSFMQSGDGFYRTFALILAFLLVVAWDRSIWLTADVLICFGFGAALIIFPKSLIDFQVTGEIDSTHLQLLRILGVVLISSAIPLVLWRSSRDATTLITYITARVFTCALLVVCILYSNFTPRGKRNIQWNKQVLWFSLLGSSLWLLGSLYHALTSWDFNTYPQFNIRLNGSLRFDAILMFISAMLFISFPDVMYKLLTEKSQMDAIHQHVTRVIGVQLIGASVISLQAPGFLHEKDKRAQFLSRIISILLLSALLLVQHFLSDLYSCSSLSTKLLISATSVILANALIGYFTQGTVIYKVPWTPEKNGPVDSAAPSSKSSPEQRGRRSHDVRRNLYS